MDSRVSYSSAEYTINPTLVEFSEGGVKFTNSSLQLDLKVEYLVRKNTYAYRDANGNLYLVSFVYSKKAGNSVIIVSDKVYLMRSK